MHAFLKLGSAPRFYVYALNVDGLSDLYADDGLFPIHIEFEMACSYCLRN